MVVEVKNRLNEKAKNKSNHKRNDPKQNGKDPYWPKQFSVRNNPLFEPRVN